MPSASSGPRVESPPTQLSPPPPPLGLQAPGRPVSRPGQNGWARGLPGVWGCRGRRRGRSEACEAVRCGGWRPCAPAAQRRLAEKWLQEAAATVVAAADNEERQARLRPPRASRGTRISRPLFKPHLHSQAPEPRRASDGASLARSRRSLRQCPETSTRGWLRIGRGPRGVALFCIARAHWLIRRGFPFERPGFRTLDRPAGGSFGDVGRTPRAPEAAESWLGRGSGE